MYLPAARDKDLIHPRCHEEEFSIGFTSMRKLIDIFILG